MYYIVEQVDENTRYMDLNNRLKEDLKEKYDVSDFPNHKIQEK